jgi:predicted nucleic acid-binding protein
VILVDTSVLVAFLRGARSEASHKLRAVLQQHVPFGINGFIFQEVLQGAKSEREYHTLKKYLSSQRFYHPIDPIDFFAAAARIYFDCRRRGLTIRSTIDCAIAQTAIEHNLLLLHDDRDYEAIGSISPLKFY